MNVVSNRKNERKKYRKRKKHELHTNQVFEIPKED